MESDLDLRELDAIFELELADEGGGQLPPDERPEPRRLPGPDPAADVWRLTWTVLGVVAGLGALKVGLFLVGGAFAMSVVGTLFVVVHALVLAAGGAWFWDKRYAR